MNRCHTEQILGRFFPLIINYWFFTCWYKCFCCSVTKTRLMLCDTMDCSIPFPSLSHRFCSVMSIELVKLFNHLILLPPLFSCSWSFPASQEYSEDSVPGLVFPQPKVLAVNLQHIISGQSSLFIIHGT